MEKKFSRNYTRKLHTLLNKSWMWHPTKQQLYGHLTPISQTIQIRGERNVGYCWKSKKELIRDVILWNPTDEHTNTGRPAKTYMHQLCVDTGYCLDDFSRAMDGRGWERERERDRERERERKSVASACLDDDNDDFLLSVCLLSHNSRIWPSLLRPLNAPTASLQRDKTSPQWMSWMWH